MAEDNYDICEDKLTTIQALMQDVDRVMARCGRQHAISGESRRHAAMKLRDAAKYIEQLPLFKD